MGSVESEISTLFVGGSRQDFFERNCVVATITAYKSETDAASDMLRGELDMVVIGDFVPSGLAADGNDIRILAALGGWGM